MIYQTKLVIRDEERDITDFIYHCHISHHNDPDLDKMIELHIKICEEIGNREDLPIEGDLIALTFNSTNHDQFFYDWLFEGAMHDGEIQFIYNEIEIADIFRFWDCYCLGVEESMSVGGAPMRLTIFLSPGIIKRNNLEAREKVWKVSSISVSNEKINQKRSDTFGTDRKISTANSSTKIILKVIHVRPPFILKRKFQNDPFYESEMRKQLQMQEDGINKMDVATWLNNRAIFKNEGRSSNSSVSQQICREKYRKEKIREYRKNKELSLKEIEAKVDAEMEYLVALHNPDQIAGGDVKDVNDMGDARINSSIGAQWGIRNRGRAMNLESDLLKILEGPPKIEKSEYGNIQMSVCFTEELVIDK